MSTLPPLDDVIDSGLVESVAARLDLRAPNRDALELIAYRLHEHYVTLDREAGFEGICDVATGVGKTYIVAGAIEYFSVLGIRNFAVIAPGRTIQRKTETQFTPGAAKSLLGSMEVEPVVVTSETSPPPRSRPRSRTPTRSSSTSSRCRRCSSPPRRSGAAHTPSRRASARRSTTTSSRSMI